MKRLSMLITAVLMMVAACTSSPSTTTTTQPGPISELLVPDVLSEFEIDTIWINGVPMTAAVADISSLRRQGLMHITDLGDLDGMVFVFEEDTTGGFWMKNTLVPLDIAFFDADGVFVDSFRMEPCVIDECETYFPSGSYRYAFEMAAGTMPNAPLALSLVEPE